MTMRFAVLLGLLGCWFAELRAEDNRFREQVAPVFRKHCLSCHNDAKSQGGLSLETAMSALRGGDSGPAIAPGDPGSSYLLDRVTPRDGKAEMPVGMPPLSVAELAALRQWIQDGANWPEGLRLQPEVWWSLRPLQPPAIPSVEPVPESFPCRNPVDAFVLAKLRERNFSPSPPADRRTLIRRVYFDLTGLPPTPEEIEAFANDPDPLAYEKLADRLLDSPRYGERWARHWLDVVHFGETHGYDKDKLRPNAWPYRDYVIRSLNQDKPWSRFVQEQVAGDVLFPDTPDGIEALGFIAAGPWDFIGHVEVPESKIDGKIARHLDRDDMVQNTITSFLSLTVGCAQCHDHKFDPITQRDYYRLQAVFAALDRADKQYFRDSQTRDQYLELTARQETLTPRLKSLQALVTELGGKELKEIEAQLAQAKSSSGQRPPEYGYHSHIAATPDEEKWVQVDFGASVTLTRVEYVACEDDFNDIGAGFGFPLRLKFELSNDPTFQRDVMILRDQTTADAPNPGTVPQSFETRQTGRYLRITATKLAPRQNDFIFALSELRAFDETAANVAAGKTVTAKDSIEAPIRWRKTNLVDGLSPGSDITTEALAALESRKETLIREKVEGKYLTELQDIRQRLADIEARLKRLPPPQHVYAGTTHHGSGNFTGSGGVPRPIHLLLRGDVTRPAELMTPAALALLPELPGEFDLSANATEGDRRAALALWLTSDRNPLLWRSMANRVWQYHFGQGLVETANDFGRMGELPSHPELLDWLAVELRTGKQSLKHLHRLIVNSSAYRQSSAPQLAANDPRPQADPVNRLLWKMNRRRLEAEAIRDAILAAAGKLDLTQGGPSFQDFVIEKPEHSPHYQYHLHDPEDPRSHRRSIYRFLVRSQTQPFMTAMDCADPSIQVARRNQTITPLQALSLLNNQLTLAMSRHFAARVERFPGDRPAQLRQAFYLVTGRPPGATELAALTTYAEKHGLPNACRALLNLNEFVFVD